MIRRALHLLLLMTLGLTFAGLPSLASADNSPSSAGDQQYVDPLSNNGSHHHSSATGSTTGSSTAPAPAPSTPTATTAASTPASTTSAKTLPFTGFQTGAALAIGCCLLGGGFLLRRRLRL